VTVINFASDNFYQCGVSSCIDIYVEVLLGKKKTAMRRSMLLTIFIFICFVHTYAHDHM